MDASPFSKLSAELRNRIWEYAVSGDLPVMITTWRDPDSVSTTFRDYKEPALSATCKQIRSKTRLMYYSHNNFQVELGDHGWIRLIRPTDLQGPAHVKTWLDAMDPEVHAATRSLTISINVPPSLFRDEFDNEENRWILMVMRLKERGYKFPRVKLVLAASSFYFPHIFRIPMVETDIKKLNEMLR
ncbi:hypothetical protein LTR08_006157 [Meristemomyces frigidus]|nr:hypothetical protein LTR08_006157 [Meristemomyces frigidus]